MTEEAGPSVASTSTSAVDASGVLTPAPATEHKYSHDLAMEAEETGPADAETSLAGSDFEPRELDLSITSQASVAPLLDASIAAPSELNRTFTESDIVATGGISSTTSASSNPSASSVQAKDQSYAMSQGGNEDSSSSCTDDEELEATNKCHLAERKQTFLVKTDCLAGLVSVCRKEGCGRKIPAEKIESTQFGCRLHLSWTCTAGHSDSWDSCPVIRRTSTVNLELATAIVCTGSTYTDFRSVADVMDMGIFSERSHTRYQERIIFPTIMMAYINQRQQLLDEIRQKQEQDPESHLVIGADGQFDSPGYSAHYCTVSAMDLDKKTILTANPVEITDPSSTSSSGMEKEGLKQILTQLIDDDQVRVEVLCTDQSSSVMTMVEDEFPLLDHQLDVWHLSKNFKRKITNLAKTRPCKELGNWQKQIRNHFIWAAKNCRTVAASLNVTDYSSILDELVASILHHICNRHEWERNDEFHYITKCCHAKLTKEQIEERGWIKENSEAHMALTNLVNEELRPLLNRCTMGLFTSELESYHNVRLKYLPKRLFYKRNAFNARSALAVLDHNINCGRPFLLDEQGQRRFRYKWSRVSNDWRKKYKRAPKQYSWRKVRPFYVDPIYC